MVVVTFCKVGYIARVYRERVRESESVGEVVASIVTAACGEEEDKRSLPLCASHCCTPLP